MVYLSLEDRKKDGKERCEKIPRHMYTYTHKDVIPFAVKQEKNSAQ